MPRSSRSRSQLAGEILPLGTLVLIAVAAMAWYVHELDLAKSLTDQSAHLNFSRLTFDSLTPGISQLGFWPPLLHILLTPFVWVNALYDTGLAAAFTLLPFVFLACFFLSRTVTLLTRNAALGVLAAVLLLLNPFFLYYGTTPMMEVMFLSNVFAVAYFIGVWLDRNQIEHLLYAGFFVTLACLSRYEGLILLPLTSLIILIQLIRKRKGYYEIEAIMLLFGLLAVCGVGFILFYSWIYSGNPLSFAGGDWLRDPAGELQLTRHNMLVSLQYVLAASTYMLGWAMVPFSLASAAVLIFFRKRLLTFSVLLLLISPVLFVYLTVYTGSIPINVPDLPPYGFFHNDRYGLTWIGFAVTASLLFIGKLGQVQKPKYVGMALRVIGNVLLVALVASSFHHLYTSAVTERFSVITRNINSPIPEQRQVAQYLRRYYDYGKILMARVDNDPIIADSGIPLENIIYEGNLTYFEQTLEEPWLFARWVLMHNPDKSGDPWARENEPVYARLGTNETFTRFYDLVLENDRRRLYKLNEDYVILLATELGYNPQSIPSLSPTVERWNPSVVYKDIRTSGAAAVTTQDLLSSKSLVKKQLLQMYRKTLRPDYGDRGYFVNAENRGNSESQSYALLQSLWSNDPTTFEKVWQWTKENLQRSDNLFSWKFAVAPDSANVIIEDANSATDADTDIAYALLEAGKKWERPEYVSEALPIIRSIWDAETAESSRGRHVLAGNWAAASGALVLNPSYFSPAAYKLFAQHDPDHAWEDVVATGYEDVDEVSAGLRPDHPNIFLPPNWVQLNQTIETFEPFEDKADSLDYSYDAFRTFWRLSMDKELNDDSNAGAYLAKADSFATDWERNKRVCSVRFFSADDRCQTDMGTLTAPLAIWMHTDERLARELLQTYHFASGELSLPESAAFYEKSWYWFGLWLWVQSE